MPFPPSSSSSYGQAGSLGPLPGMTYDPIRKRYFPTPIAAHGIPAGTVPPPRPPTIPRTRPENDDNLLPVTECVEGKAKRRRVRFDEAGGFADGPSGSRRGVRLRGSPESSAMAAHFASLTETESHRIGYCPGERVVSYQSHLKGSYRAATDHGNVVVRNAGGMTYQVPVCQNSLVGVYDDIPRMMITAIAAGPEPHIHRYRRDTENIEQFSLEQIHIDMPRGDVFCMSWFDGICTLGCTRSLVTLRSDTAAMTRRNLRSDALAVHQADHNLVYVGLRRGTVALEDLRVSEGIDSVGAGMRVGKAVVGVKRLSDGAVPWGLVASGMNNEPLHRLERHVNSYYSTLGLATSPDDTLLLAAGSDSRIRCWSTLTGQQVPAKRSQAFSCDMQVAPPDTLLDTMFAERVTHLAIREDWGVDAVVQGMVHRFGKVPKTRGRGWGDATKRGGQLDDEDQWEEEE